MADHILHHHNGVVHQDTDGKNQRKKRDSVQRVSIQIKHRQGQGQGHRNGQGHNARFPASQGKPDENGHRHHRDHHMVEQFVGFFLGGFAVMAGDGHMDIVRNDRSPGIFDPP